MLEAPGKISPRFFLADAGGQGGHLFDRYRRGKNLICRRNSRHERTRIDASGKENDTQAGAWP